MKKIIITGFLILLLTIVWLLLYFKDDTHNNEIQYQFNTNTITWWILQDTLSDQDL